MSPVINIHTLLSSRYGFQKSISYLLPVCFGCSYKINGSKHYLGVNISIFNLTFDLLS